MTDASTWTAAIKESDGYVEGYIKLVTGQGTMDVVTAARTGDALVATNIVAFRTRFMTREIDGTTIQASDLKVVADGAVAVSKGNKIRIGDDDYNITHLDEVNFSGTTVGYTLGVRL